MRLPPELVTALPVIVALLSLIVQYRQAGRSGSGLFAYGLLMAAAIAVAIIAISAAPADQAAQAVADIGILLAGALAFAASGWLLFAFSQAGDTDGR